MPHLLIHATTDGHWDSFQFGAVTNNALSTFSVCLSYMHALVGYLSRRVKILPVFQNGSTNLYLCKQHMKVPVVSYLAQHLC